jgi:hypothetical protein
MRPFRSVPLLLKLLPLLLLRVQRLLRRLARLCLLAGLGGTAGLARFVGLPLIRAHHTDQPIIPTRPPRLRRPASGHVRREGRSKENRSRKDSHRLVQHGTVCMHRQVLLYDLILDTDTDIDIDIVTPIQSHWGNFTAPRFFGRWLGQGAVRSRMTSHTTPHHAAPRRTTRHSPTSSNHDQTSDHIGWDHGRRLLGTSAPGGGLSHACPPR